jgi:hypothetical protein
LTPTRRCDLRKIPRVRLFAMAAAAPVTAAASAPVSPRQES